MEQKINILMDERDIRNCLYRYNRSGDRGDLALMASCFHHDAVDHHAPFFDCGIAEVLGFMGETIDTAAEVMQYNTGTVNIDLQGDIAQVESYIWSAKKMHEVNENGIPLIRLSGARYVDRFERRAGEWRIAERWFVPEWGFFKAVPPLTESVGVILAPQDMKLKPVPSKRFPDDISYKIAEADA